MAIEPSDAIDADPEPAVEGAIDSDTVGESVVPEESPPPSPAQMAEAAEAAVSAVIAADPNLTSVTLALSSDAIDYLNQEAERRKVSAGEVVRIAIGALKYITDQTAMGGKVQLRTTREVLDLTF